MGVFSYRISSFECRGVYKSPKVLDAVYFKRRRLLEGGV